MPAQRDPSSLALALSGGGARAAYQVGVLAGIAEQARVSPSFPIITGVSAGAINAAALAAHSQRPFEQSVAMLEQAWLGMSTSSVFRTGPFSVLRTGLKSLGMLLSGRLQARGLLDSRPLRRTLSNYFTREDIEANLDAGCLTALALSSTSYPTGRTVTFVHGGRNVPMWTRAGRVAQREAITVDHVLASCALPILFPAVRVGQEYLGDGSLRQLTPLAPAVHLGAGRLLAVSVRYPRSPDEEARRQVTGYPPAAQVLGMLFNAVFLDALEHDAERLQRINDWLGQLPAGGPRPSGLRPIELVVLRPSQDLGRLAADLEHCLPGPLRYLVRSLGTGHSAPDLLSFILFERPYIEPTHYTKVN